MTNKIKLGRGVIAVCQAGRIGIIDVNEPQITTYSDGHTDTTWTGLHIWPLEYFGKPWSSKHPTPLIDVDKGRMFLDNFAQHYRPVITKGQ